MIANAIVSNRQACDYLDKQQKKPQNLHIKWYQVKIQNQYCSPANFKLITEKKTIIESEVSEECEKTDKLEEIAINLSIPKCIFHFKKQ